MKELRKYQSFKNVAEMDESIDLYLKKYDLKESERVILLKIAAYSCKFPGVSYLKLDTLAKVTFYVKRTVQRALKKFIDLGIITRIEQFKPVRGGNGASINVITPFAVHESLAVQSTSEEELESTESKDEEQLAHIETINYKAKSSKELKIRNSEPANVNELDVSYLTNSHIPTEFINAVKPFIGSAKEVYSLWGKVLLAQKKHAQSLTDYTEIAITAFKQSVFALKMNKIRKGFKGYFFGVLAKMMSVEQRKLKCKLFNFLGE